jgi:cobalt-zinc-cadmium efflux system membrane fusion protein
MNSKNIILFALLGTFLLIGASSCSSNKPEVEGIEITEVPDQLNEIKVTDEQFNAMKMEWGQLHIGEFSEELSVQGTVKIPVEGLREISAYYGGFVQDLKLIEGEAVRKGQVLFTLENPDFIRLQQEFLETKSQLTYLKSEFERQKTLAEEQISSQKTFFKAESEYRSALAKNESLKKQLALIQINADLLSPESIRSKVPILSPINGFVEDVFVIPGQFLPTAGKALSLLSRDHIHIELVLFEKDAGRVHPGQKVEVRSPDSPGDILQAKVYVVGQSINEQHQINVHSHLIDERLGSKLTPGMFLQARIQLDHKISLAVPEESILELDEEKYILIQKSKTETGFILEKVKVKPGAKSKQYVAIEPEKSLDSTTVVLLKGGFNLL